MAGKGFAPKDPSKRAGHSKDTTPTSEIEHRRCPQPSLPDGMDWHPQTVIWWAMWGESPQAAEFMATDWSVLLDTALMHSAMWDKGQWTLAAEVRLRVAKFGATPEDRQRLRMHFAPDEGDAPAKPAAAPSSRQRYGTLRSLPSAVSE